MKLLLVFSFLLLLEMPFHTLADSSSSSSPQKEQEKNGDGTKDQLHTRNYIKVLVKFITDEGKEQAKTKASKVNYESERFNVVAIDLDPAQLDELEKDPGIELVDLDHEASILPPVIRDDPPHLQAQEFNPTKPHNNKSPPNHRKLEEQVPWGIQAIQADQVSPGPYARDIKICIVDTGYDIDHTDLPGRNTVNGTDSEDLESNLGYSGHDWDIDANGHGTHVAGTIAALGENDQGVIGVIPNANPDGITLHIGRAFDDSGVGTVASIIEAVDACIDAEADIIKMSFQVIYSQTLEDILSEAYHDNGILLVAVAGNEGDANFTYPGSWGSVMSVGAVEDSLDVRPHPTIADFSQYNLLVEISGPGVDINSTLPGNAYSVSSGTSMAAPHVTGTAALVWSYNSSCTAQQIRRILIASARDLGDPGCDEYFGHGMVQAKDAVEMLETGGCSAADGLPLLDADGMNSDGSLCSSTSYPYEDICHDGTETMTLELLTDDYPKETSWEVVDFMGLRAGSGGGYDLSETLCTEEVTVCKGKSYAFTIIDSFWDGICCTHGNGTYTVMVGDEVVKENGGVFGYSETTIFEVPGPVPPEPGPSPIHTSPPSQDSGNTGQCLLKKCCEHMCCGAGTAWDSRLGCVKDDSSTAWKGRHTGRAACEVWLCCEAHCCHRRIGTVYDSTKAACVPISADD